MFWKYASHSSTFTDPKSFLEISSGFFLYQIAIIKKEVIFPTVLKVTGLLSLSNFNNTNNNQP